MEDNDAKNNVEDSFLKVLSANLMGKRWTHYLKQLKFNLKCVNRGLKPAYLWDLGPATDLQTITKLIDDLKRDQLMVTSIYVICYESEVFIVNLEATKKFLEEFQVKFVDTYSKSEPKLIDSASTRQLISIFKNKTENFSQKHESNLLQSETSLKLEFVDDMDVFPPTIYGLLLGYPIVYWNSSRNDDSNNLSFRPLCVFEVIWEAGIMYKFSAPVLLELVGFVGDWVNWLRTELKVELSLSVENVVLPCVQL